MSAFGKQVHFDGHLVFKKLLGIECGFLDLAGLIIAGMHEEGWRGGFVHQVEHSVVYD